MTEMQINYQLWTLFLMGSDNHTNSSAPRQPEKDLPWHHTAADRKSNIGAELELLVPMFESCCLVWWQSNIGIFKHGSRCLDAHCRQIGMIIRSPFQCVWSLNLNYDSISLLLVSKLCFPEEIIYLATNFKAKVKVKVVVGFTKSGN